MKFREWIEESRTPEEVFDDHLMLRQGSHNHIEQDLARNYADNVILHTNFGNFRGKDGVRKCSSILAKQLPCAKYDYVKKEVKGNKAELYWTGECNNAKVEDGYDIFVFHNGKIVQQDIFYTVQQK